MNSSVGSTMRTLNDCGCCEGISTQTPVRIYNRPGLTALAYRVGTHAQFKQTLLARLSSLKQSVLSKLTTRDDDDFSIALIDAWATVADVLTFYQERVANEAYLRTATERRSIIELARLINYKLRPGVAASTFLAFTCEDAPGVLGQALSLTTARLAPEPLPAIPIGIGTKVQSVPAPGELARTFETIEAIAARAEWNAIKPRLTQPQSLSTSMEFAILKGMATDLRQGDMLLIVDAVSNPVPRRALSVKADDKVGTTRVDFVNPPPSVPPYVRPACLAKGTLKEFATRMSLDDSVVEQIVNRTWSEDDLSALAKLQGWSADSLTRAIVKQTSQPKATAHTGIFTFRQRVALFGHNAQDWNTLPLALRVGEFPPSPELGRLGRTFIKGVYADRKNSWADAAFPPDTTTIYLDAVYSKIAPEPDSWIVLASPTDIRVFRIVGVAEETRSDFNMSLKVTRLTISGADINKFSPRNATVYVQSESLELAELSVEDVVPDGEATLTLDRVYFGLKAGQKIILTGERSDLKSVIASEVVEVKEVTVEGGFTVLTFKQPPSYKYVRRTSNQTGTQTVTLNANVALATHGETVQEVLGGGDSTQPFPCFSLRQPPLTYVSASTASGAETTLEVRVNDLLWREVETFYDHGPHERVYVTRLDDDGKTSVVFGDGKTGARLPTGQENVKAKYRKGIGLPGLVKADQLTQLMTRPLGVKGVTNPNASSGAADAEQLADGRRNAPLTVLTLGRVVSLQDYEDFARAFSGIDKALATWTWIGHKRGVFVTVAGTKGAEVTTDGPLYGNLLDAMRKAGDSTVPLLVQSYQPRFFRLSAGVQLDPNYLPEQVLAEITNTMRARFSFEARQFGQPVHLSEVIALVQNVHGVAAVDIDEFYRSDQSPGSTPQPRLEAATPQSGHDTIFAAELLTLDPRPLGLVVMS
jgi:hypothetical protein